MPGKMALVDYKRCHPGRCDSGADTAIAACSHKLLKQEAPYGPICMPRLWRLCPGLSLEGDQGSDNLGNKAENKRRFGWKQP
jgi:hypothetical protein